MPEICGIHHLKFPVADIETSCAFYERVFGAQRIVPYDHRREDGTLYAIIMEVSNLGTHLELRLNGKAAKAQEQFDPVTLAVRGRGDLEQWSDHLDAAGIEHSPILTGMAGYLLVFEDPDARRLRLYTHEKPPANTPTSKDNRWLG